MSRTSHISITREGEDFIFDAEPVAARFGLSAEAFMQALASGEIVTTTEAGQGEDAGRTRLTFRRGALLWRFILHADNTITEDPVLAGVAAPRRGKG
jgi:hypothetical protein